MITLNNIHNHTSNECYMQLAFADKVTCDSGVNPWMLLKQRLGEEEGKPRLQYCGNMNSEETYSYHLDEKRTLFVQLSAIAHQEYTHACVSIYSVQVYLDILNGRDSNRDDDPSIFILRRR